MSQRSFVIASFLFLLLWQPPLRAQTGSGKIEGTVKDPSGAIVPGADISVVHVQTARQFDTITNSAGYYLFPSLQTGSYKITAQVPGMQKWEGDLLLQVGQTAVVDPVLTIGATATEITVVGDVTPLVTTANPTLGNVVERTRIDQLPLNGRFFQTLVQQTTPGL